MNNNSDIEAILKATIQTKVVEAFNEVPDMIEKLVEAALSNDVDEDGRKPEYGRKSMPYMDYLVGREIRNAVSEAVKNHFSQHKDLVRQRVEECIQSGDYGRSMADAVTEILSETYRWGVSLNIERDD